MSNITGITPANHSFVTLDKNTSALTGQRLVRLIAKSARGTDKPSNPNLTQSLAVSIPYVSMDEVVNVIDKLIPHVIGMVQDTQDKIIREYRIESGNETINQSLIDVNAVIAYLDASATGERVSKEYLQDWFTSEYEDITKQWINQIAGGSLSDIVIDQKTNLMRDMIAGWASPKYSPNIPSLKAQIRFMNDCVSNEVSDARMNGILDKAKNMLDKKEKELSTDALGF